MSQESLENFRRFVFTDQTLQERLRAIEDRTEFITEVCRSGLENGFEFSADDVAESLRMARMVWIERWI